jgi:hypothetical protein
MLASIVDTGKLFEAAWTSLAGVVGVTLAFSLLVVGVARSSDLGREGRPVAATAYGALAVLGLAACVGALALGLIVMTTK